MMFSPVLRGACVCALLALLSAPALANPKIVKVPATAAPIEVSAAYRISLNGFNLGSLQFNARIENGTYVADSDVNLSALLGAFHWRGVTRTAGTLSGAAHQPQAYSFDFDGSVKSGSVRMGFTGPEITTVKVLPTTFTAPDTVPLERQHLKGALDPLSAVIALIRVEGDTPCGRKLPIFDGKQRFDLSLVFRREGPVGTGPGGAPLTGTVCKIKYTPIAGFRANAETQALAQSNGIEIAFRRIPAAGLSVPQRVVIPTLAGDAVIEAIRVNIEAGGRGLIAQVE